MRLNQENTPPSSVSGDEIASMDQEEGVFYLDEMEEVQLEDLMDMEDDEEREPPEDHSSLVFDEHAGSVFCGDLHPDGKLAVTGGEDDKAYVWSVQTGRVIMECTGHKDSVVIVGFSFDGVYLATADMSGLIKVWKCNLDENQQVPWTVAFEYVADDLTFGMWHFGARVLICGAVSGDIYVFKIPSGDTKLLQGHNSRVECAKMFKDGVRLVAGYDDGAVKVWDLKTNTVLQQVEASVHNQRVTTVDTHPENNLMVSISSDGKVILATSNNGKIVGQVEADNDLETVAFADTSLSGYFALGTLNGEVGIWDIGRQMLRHQCTKADDESVVGVTKMIWVKNHIVTGCLDGSIRVYEGRSGDKCLTLTGHRSGVLDLCYNAVENIILTSSDDGTARIFKYDINKDKD